MKQRIPAKIVSGEPRCKLELTDWNRRNLDNLMKSFEGKDVWVSIEKQTKQRSNPQNNYLWGVPYELISKETGMDKESIHAFAKNEFLSTKGDGPIPKVKSTKKLSTTEFMEFVEKLIKWSSEFLGLYIPLPNEEEMWSVLNDDKGE